jgi:4,5-dihydroxyphthalate decarboxylase
LSDKRRLTIATWDYDHVRDFRLGPVRAEGIDVTWLVMDFHDIFARFIANREWDVTEMSFAKFVSEVTRSDADIIGLPVYIRRAFRFGFVFVNRKNGIKRPEDLRGKRIGIPDWGQTATVYMRGWLQHNVGIPLSEIDWVQAGTNEPGRLELVDMTLPAGLRLSEITDKTLSDMLISGELDCVIAATPPKAFGQHPDVVRLFPDVRAMDESYYAATHIYPIMHIIAMRKEILREDPWIARNLYDAFEEARRRAMDRIRRGLDYPMPWLANHAAAVERTFGHDFFPYGINENRSTLELFLQYAHEQGVAHKRAQPEDIFPKGIMIAGRI